jgi:TM2 domain-containing membrane protein YozV
VSQVRPETYKSIEENDIEKVAFSDPFSDVARKSKRNLVVSGFIGLLVSLLNLEINGFLGLKATNMNLGNDIAQGLAFFIIMYFLLSFIFQAYIDYSAWNFKREKQLTQPYFDLVSLIESHIDVTGVHINNATLRLDSLSLEENMQAQVEVSKQITSTKQNLESTKTQLSSFVNEISPLLNHWKITIAKMDHLSLRLKVRFINLWVLDIAFPLIVSSTALYLCYSSIPALITKLTS